MATILLWWRKPSLQRVLVWSCPMCQEIGLVTLMFFFELFIFLCCSQFPSMFPLLTYSQSFFFLICCSPETLKTKEKQEFDSIDTGNSLKVILRLRNPSRFPNRLVDPLVDLYQSLHSNSASTTSISPSISTTRASSILSTPSVRGTAWYSLATRGLVFGGGVGGGVGRMVCCNSYSNG